MKNMKNILEKHNLKPLPENEMVNNMEVFYINFGNGHLMKGVLKYSEKYQSWYFDSPYYTQGVLNGVFVTKS
jgi:hypothetical protein